MILWCRAGAPSGCNIALLGGAAARFSQRFLSMSSQFISPAGDRTDASAFAEDRSQWESGAGEAQRVIRGLRSVLPQRLSLRLAVAVMVALTLWRIITLSFDTTDLFVDEAQYWLWSRHLAFGYYSKPPMIAWIIRAMAEVTGSNGIFALRVCGPLFHLGTGLVLTQVSKRLFDRSVAAWTGLTYVTLPGVALSSVFFSTDVILLFFLSVALWAYLVLTEKPSVPVAIVFGLSVGAAFLSKYAILFLLPGAVVCLVCLPKARLSWRDLCIAIAVAAVASLPNLWWNLNNQMITVTHTETIAHWSDMKLRLLGGLEFFGAQFGVVGPIVFAALLVALYQAVKEGGDWRTQLLLLLSIPVIGLICLQATVAKAYANWAVAAYVAGMPLAVHTLRNAWPQGLRWSLLLNGTVSVLVALSPVFALEISAAAGPTVMDRYLGRSEVSRAAAKVALELSLKDIVSDDRDILADMFFTLRGEGFAVYSRVGAGAPKSYYDQMFAVPRGLNELVLFVSLRPFACAGGYALPVATWRPQTGAYRGKAIYAYKADPSCLTME